MCRNWDIRLLQRTYNKPANMVLPLLHFGWEEGEREEREREEGGEKIRWREVKGRKYRLKREEGGEEKDREGERREERNKRWGGRG